MAGPASHLVLRFAPAAGAGSGSTGQVNISLALATRLPDGVGGWSSSAVPGLSATLTVPFGKQGGGGGGDDDNWVPCASARLVGVNPAELPRLELEDISYADSEPSYSGPDGEPLVIYLEDDGQTITPTTEWTLYLRFPTGDLFPDWTWPEGEFEIDDAPEGKTNPDLTIELGAARLRYPMRVVSVISETETLLVAARLPEDAPAGAPTIIAEDGELVPADAGEPLFRLTSADVAEALGWAVGVERTLTLRVYRPDGSVVWQGLCDQGTEIGTVTVAEQNPLGLDQTAELDAARVRLQYAWPICHSAEFVSVTPNDELAPLVQSQCAYNESSLQYDGPSDEPLLLLLNEEGTVAAEDDWTLCLSFVRQNLWSDFNLTKPIGNFTYTPRPGVEEPGWLVELNRFAHRTDRVGGIRFPMRLRAEREGQISQPIVAERIREDCPILITQGPKSIRLKPRLPTDPPSPDPDRPDGALFALTAAELATALGPEPGLYNLRWLIYQGDGQMVWDGFCRSRTAAGEDDLLPPIRGQVLVGEALTEHGGDFGLVVESEAIVAQVRIVGDAAFRIMLNGQRYDLATGGSATTSTGPIGQGYWVGAYQGTPIYLHWWGGGSVWCDQQPVAALPRSMQCVGMVDLEEMVNEQPVTFACLIYAERSGQDVRFYRYRLDTKAEALIATATLGTIVQDRYYPPEFLLSPTAGRCAAVFAPHAYRDQDGAIASLQDGLVEECVLTGLTGTDQTWTWSAVTVPVSPANGEGMLQEQHTTEETSTPGTPPENWPPDMEYPPTTTTTTTDSVQWDGSWTMLCGARYTNEGTLDIQSFTVRQVLNMSNTLILSNRDIPNVTPPSTRYEAYTNSESVTLEHGGGLIPLRVANLSGTVDPLSTATGDATDTKCIFHRNLTQGPSGLQIGPSQRCITTAPTVHNWSYDRSRSLKFGGGETFPLPTKYDDDTKLDLGTATVSGNGPVWDQLRLYASAIMVDEGYGRVPSPDSWMLDVPVPALATADGLWVNGTHVALADGPLSAMVPVQARLLKRAPAYAAIPDGSPVPDLSISGLCALHNNARAADSLPALAFSNALCQAALTHAQWLAAQELEQPTHTGPEGLESPTYRARAAGYPSGGTAEENLAVAAYDINELNEALLSSPGHRRKLMAPTATHFGAATLDATRWGRLWVCLIGATET